MPAFSTIYLLLMSECSSIAQVGKHWQEENIDDSLFLLLQHLLTLCSFLPLYLDDSLLDDFNDSRLSQASFPHPMCKCNLPLLKIVFKTCQNVTSLSNTPLFHHPFPLPLDSLVSTFGSITNSEDLGNEGRA